MAAVTLLGIPRLRIDGREHPLPRKALVLMAVIALEPAGEVTRGRLRGLLWGTRPQTAASANLRQLISRITRIERTLDVNLIAMDGELIRLAPGRVQHDLVPLVPWVLRAAAGDPVALWNAVRAYGGDLLADFHAEDDVLDEWLQRERATLKVGFVSAAVGLLQSGHTNPADDLEIASRLLSVEPANEVAHRARIKAYGLRGEISRSRMAYLECERILRLDLGVTPSPETIALASRFFETMAGQQRGDDQPPRLESAPVERPGDARPRIVILPPVDPFDNRRLHRLTNFMLEDVVQGLARFRSFRIIASHTAIAISSGSAPRIQTPDWCDYVLSSVLSASGIGYELKYRLTDIRSGEVAWSAAIQFEGHDLPHLYSVLTDRAIAALANSLEQREVERVEPPHEAKAYRLYLEARQHLQSTSLAEIRRARRLFRAAHKLDPNFAAPIAGTARSLTMEWILRGAPDCGLLDAAVAAADRAITTDARDARGFRERAYALLYLKRHDESLALFSEAALMNPNDADLLADYADAMAHSGDPVSASTVLDRALTLNPSPPRFYRWVQASIHYQTGRYREAIAALAPFRRDPAIARLLAASYAQSGEENKAQQLLRIARQNLPDLQAEHLWVIVPNRYESDTRHLIEGLRKAGIP